MSPWGLKAAGAALSEVGAIGPDWSHTFFQNFSKIFSIDPSAQVKEVSAAGRDRMLRSSGRKSTQPRPSCLG
jgi:hypothetical protein